MDAAGAASQPPRAHLPRSRGWLVLASSDSEHERSLPNASTDRSGDINKVSAVMQEVVVRLAKELRAIGDRENIEHEGALSTSVGRIV
jgi:hypothetical protein